MTERRTNDSGEQLSKPGRWGQDRRLEFIDFRLHWEGRVNRADLTNFFGISVPQASLDLARYMELAPANMEYDRSEKAYLATATFSPVVTPLDAHGYLNQLLGIALGVLPKETSFLGWPPPVAAVRFPNRQIDATVLRRVLNSIHGRRSLHIEYQSMNRLSPTIRDISPHAIGYDGYRWHTRAFCHENCDFRDFVFARILRVLSDAPSDVDPQDDAAWLRELELVIAPHPGLTEGQRRAIELDYGMDSGRVVVQTREALLFYVLRRLRLDRPEVGTPQAQQIVLINRKELEPFLVTAG